MGIALARGYQRIFSHGEVSESLLKLRSKVPMLPIMTRSRVLSIAAPAASFKVSRPGVFRGSALLVCGASALLLSLAAVNVPAQQAATALTA